MGWKRCFGNPEIPFAITQKNDFFFLSVVGFLGDFPIFWGEAAVGSAFFFFGSFSGTDFWVLTNVWIFFERRLFTGHRIFPKTGEFFIRCIK